MTSGLIKTNCICLLCTLLFSSGANASLWDEAKQKSNSVTGKVKSFAINDDSVRVRIGDETFTVCSSFPGGDALNLMETARVKILHDAFEHGDTVRVSYNGPFERCLDTVSVTREEPTAELPIKKTTSSL